MAATLNCPIWGTPVEELAHSGNGDIKVRSPRTDGEYRITGLARSVVARMTPKEKAQLTTWIVDQRRSGEVAPLVNEEVLQKIPARHPLRMSQRKQRFFLLALSHDFQPSSAFRVSGVVDEKQLRDTGAISAWTECQTDAECGGLLRLLKEADLINYGGGDLVTLTGKGFDLLESLEVGGAPTRQAFVAMWFDLSMDEAYRAGFAPAIEEAGFAPLRIDRKEHGNKVDDEIIAEIRRSRFVIADFTCGLFHHQDRQFAAARGGVYYEAGFAQGLGTPVIWTCRADCIDHVHFDTRQYNHIVWSTPEELRPKLNNRIRAVIV
jgi:hypothetical protein